MRFTQISCSLLAFVTCFATSLVPAQSFIPPYREVNVLDYGANGSDTVDDYTAITNAIAAAGSGGTLIFPKGVYYLSAGLVVTSAQANDQTWRMDGAVLYPISGASPFAMVTIGTAGAGNNFYRFRMYGGKLWWSTSGTGSTATWSSSASAGIKLINGSHCQFFGQDVAGFNTGIFLDGNGGACDLNTFVPANVQGNRTGIHVYAESGGECNGNSFLGGSHVDYTAFDPTTPAPDCCIRLDRDSTTGGSSAVTDCSFVGLYLEKPSSLTANAVYASCGGCLFAVTYDGFITTPFIVGGIDFSSNRFLTGLQMLDATKAIDTTLTPGAKYTVFGDNNVMAGGSVNTAGVSSGLLTPNEVVDGTEETL